MFCQKCGNKLSETATFCNNCGDRVSDISNEDRAVNIKIIEKQKVPYSTAKLVIGIISMILFLFICMQSCAAGISNAISENGETSGTSGFFCAFFMLIGGIISVATKNSKGKGGSISAIIMYTIAFLFTIGTGASYPDLPVWGSIAFIFGMINLASILATNRFFSQKKNKNLLIIGLIIISIICFFISILPNITIVDDDTSKDNQTINDSTNEDSNTSKKDNYTLNETFKFDDLEITIEDNISYTTLSNIFSDYNGKTVVKIPVTVKNVKDEAHSLNMFYYKIYGSQGIELKSISTYFSNDSIDYAGELRPGASYTKYFYLLYDGNGTYTIELDNWSKKITVEFDVNK